MSTKTRKTTAQTVKTAAAPKKAPAKPKAKKPATQASLDGNSVALRSYLLWEQAGRPQGRDVEFWLQAEQELAGN
jgi:hypothetical protein